jgi:ketosteroid isomerase-like protein
MKTYAILSFALVALVASHARPRPTPHELTDAARADVESAVSDFLTNYLAVIEGGDTEAIRGLYVEDDRFAWFTDGEKRYASGDEVLAGLASMEGMTFSTEASDVEVIPLTPDLAHARSAFQTKILQEGAVVFEFAGVTTWLIEAGKDGEWRVLSGHTSTPKEGR